ncbi:MAG: hypothetical protein R8K20_11390, partial [Gallionellaceae bacterium]
TDKGLAAQQYFDDVVAPQVGKNTDLAEVARQFSSYSGFEMSQTDKPAMQEDTGNRVYDTGLDVAKGAVSLGQSAVGLAGMATGGLVSKGMRYLGYDPKQTSTFLSSLYSDARKIEESEISRAKGFSGTVGALIDNPMATIGKVVESAPMMLSVNSAAKFMAAKAAAAAHSSAIAAGATVAKAEIIAAAAAAASATVASSIVEGAQSAGISFDELSAKGVDLGRNYVASIGTGVGTAATSLALGKLGKKLGAGDVDAGVGGSGNVFLRVPKAGVQEGSEELVQSSQEKVWGNWAEKKDLMEGVPEAAATGLVVGAGAGAGVSLAIGGNQETDPLDNEKQVKLEPSQSEMNAKDAESPKVPESQATIGLQLLEMVQGE